MATTSTENAPGVTDTFGYASAAGRGGVPRGRADTEAAPQGKGSSRLATAGGGVLRRATHQPAGVGTPPKASTALATVARVRTLKDPESRKHLARKAGRTLLKAAWKALKLVPPPYNYFIAAGGVLLILVVIMAVVFIAAGGAAMMQQSSMKAAAFPNVHESVVGTDAPLSDDDLAALQHAMDTQAPEVMACLADVPPVTHTAQPEYVRTPTEAEAAIRAEQDRRKAVEETWGGAQTPADRRKLEHAQQRERDYRSEWDAKQLLLDDHGPAIAPGQQVMGETGKVKSDVAAYAFDIPKGTPAVVAKAYLVVMLAGGESTWEHFVTVADATIPGGLAGITEASLRHTYQVYLGPGFDPAPYERVAESQIVVLAMDKRVTGNIDSVAGDYLSCFEKSHASAG